MKKPQSDLVRWTKQKYKTAQTGFYNSILDNQEREIPVSYAPLRRDKNGVLEGSSNSNSILLDSMLTPEQVITNLEHEIQHINFKNLEKSRKPEDKKLVNDLKQLYKYYKDNDKVLEGSDSYQEPLIRFNLNQESSEFNNGINPVNREEYLLKALLKQGKIKEIPTIQQEGGKIKYAQTNAQLKPYKEKTLFQKTKNKLLDLNEVLQHPISSFSRAVQGDYDQGKYRDNILLDDFTLGAPVQLANRLVDYLKDPVNNVVKPIGKTLGNTALAIEGRQPVSFTEDILPGIGVVGDLAGVNLIRRLIPTRNKFTGNQFDAVQNRAERVLSQEKKWVDQNWEGKKYDLESSLKNARKNHNDNTLAVSKGKRPENIGSNLGDEGIDGTYVWKDNNLSPVNKSRVAAHETGHYYQNSKEEGLDWLQAFNEHQLSTYLKGRGLKNRGKKDLFGNSSFDSIDQRSNGIGYGNELRERAAQLKDFIAEKYKIPLNKDFKISESQLDFAIDNYVKNTGLNNDMTEFINAIKDKKQLLNVMNKYALSTIPITAGAATLSMQKQTGGKLDKYVVAQTNKNTIQPISTATKPEELYDLVFEYAESKKEENQENNYAQTGTSTKYLNAVKDLYNINPNDPLITKEDRVAILSKKDSAIKFAKDNNLDVTETIDILKKAEEKTNNWLKVRSPNFNPNKEITYQKYDSKGTTTGKYSNLLNSVYLDLDAINKTEKDNISNSLNSTLYHEITHGNVDKGLNNTNYEKIGLIPTDTISKRYEAQFLQENPSKKEKDSWYKYSTSPSEVYSRLMQFRLDNNIDPKKKFTDSDILGLNLYIPKEEELQDFYKTNSNVNKNENYIDFRKRIINNINETKQKFDFNINHIPAYYNLPEDKNLIKLLNELTLKNNKKINLNNMYTQTGGRLDKYVVAQREINTMQPSSTAVKPTLKKNIFKNYNKYNTNSKEFNEWLLGYDKAVPMLSKAYMDGDVVRKLTNTNTVTERDLEDLNDVKNKNELFFKNRYQSDNNIKLLDNKYNIRNNSNINKNLVRDIVVAAKKNRVDPYLALSIGLRESNLGDNESVPLHPKRIFQNHNTVDDILNKTLSSTTNINKPIFTNPTTGTYIYNSNFSRDYSNNNIEQIKKYHKNLAEEMSKPLDDEMKTILNKSKKYGIRGYNYGDPDYANKVAKEREILFFDENKPFRDYVDSIKQDGGQPTQNPQVIAEDKEYVKTDEGNVMKITNAPTHNDNVIATPQGNRRTDDRGGILVEGVQSVLSATHENRNSKDRLYTEKDEEIKIMPQEAFDFAKSIGLPITKPSKGISPAKLLDHLIDKREAIAKQYKKIEVNETTGRVAFNSLRANKAVLAGLPKPEELYDLVFEYAESKKEENQEPVVKQTGGRLDKYLINKGDTLFEIAKATNSSVKELQKLNNIKNVNLIKENTELFIPNQTNIKNKDLSKVIGYDFYERDLPEFKVSAPRLIPQTKDNTRVQSNSIELRNRQGLAQPKEVNKLSKSVKTQNAYEKGYGHNSNYTIIDKQNATINYFDAQSNLLKTEPIILGQNKGDETLELSQKEFLKDNPDAQKEDYFAYLDKRDTRITPSGRFVNSNNRNVKKDPNVKRRLFNSIFRPDVQETVTNHRKESYGEGNLISLINEQGLGQSFAIHNTGYKNREESLKDNNSNNNRLSNGCINVGGKTICFQQNKKGNETIILPESGELVKKKENVEKINISDSDMFNIKKTKIQVVDALRKYNVKNPSKEAIDFITAVAGKETDFGNSTMLKIENILPSDLIKSKGKFQINPKSFSTFLPLDYKEDNEDSQIAAVYKMYSNLKKANPNSKVSRFYDFYNNGTRNKSNKDISATFDRIYKKVSSI